MLVLGLEARILEHAQRWLVGRAILIQLGRVHVEREPVRVGRGDLDDTRLAVEARGDAPAVR